MPENADGGGEGRADGERMDGAGPAPAVPAGFLFALRRHTQHTVQQQPRDIFFKKWHV